MSIDGWLFGGFIVCMAILAYTQRHRLAIQRILGPFLYLALYRSTVGIGAMNWIAKRFEKPIRWITPLIILTGFLGMILVSVEIIASFYNILVNPATSAGVALVLPIKAKGIFYVPFLYWIISIFFVVIVHEGGHGVLAAANKIRIKSSGLAALSIGVPIIPAAFVEPDEKVLQKRPAKEQLAVFAAGPFANIALGLIIAVLFINLTNPFVEGFYQKDGLLVTSLAEGDLPIKTTTLGAGAIITAVDGKTITDLASLNTIFKDKKIGDPVTLTATINGETGQTILSTLGEHPDKKGTPYLGVFLDQAKHAIVTSWWTAPVEWFNELLLWIMAMNFGVGLFNLLPLGIVDGGRMLHTALHRFLRTEHANATWAAVSGMFLFAVVGSMVLTAVR